MFIARTGLAILLIGYPVIIYFGLNYLDPRLFAGALITFAVLRLLLDKHSERTTGVASQSMPIYVAAILVAICLAALDPVLMLRFYPALVNAIFFAIFAASLIWPPSMIEKIARLTTPNLPEQGVRYTRTVTFVWCGFFVFNALVSVATTLWASMEVWALYNGLISYLLIAAIYSVEYLIRRRVRRKNEVRERTESWPQQRQI